MVLNPSIRATLAVESHVSPLVSATANAELPITLPPPVSLDWSSFDILIAGLGGVLEPVRS